MDLTASVEAKMVVDGFHHWPQAPQEVAFLRARHRHQFVVRATKRVQHDDRDIEFILLAQQVRAVLYASFEAHRPTGALEFGSSSCEHLARLVCQELDLDACSVHEDDENGAVVRRVV